jgi:dimethylhistidine N-methyltransferase
MTVNARIARRETVTHEPVVHESQFARDAVAGLTAKPKRMSPKYFYDETGSQLFEEITELPEYYPTRCELAILRAHGAEIGRMLPDRTALIEFGSGSTRKVRLLLDAASTIEAYVPVDISAEMLVQEAAQLEQDYPGLKVWPVAADITTSFRLPKGIAGMARAGFFPGSTIGNFEPHQASAFLENAARILGEHAVLVVGVDLVKDAHVLNAAYDDAAGVTGRFNLNLLTRMNRELGADFDLDAFRHQAFYNAQRKRVEMHLVSRKRQKVRLCSRIIDFGEAETIHTESSYKYTVESFGNLARGAGWAPATLWTDPQGYFLVQALVRG